MYRSGHPSLRQQKNVVKGGAGVVVHRTEPHGATIQCLPPIAHWTGRCNPQESQTRQYPHHLPNPKQGRMRSTTNTSSNTARRHDARNATHCHLTCTPYHTASTINRNLGTCDVNGEVRGATVRNSLQTTRKSRSHIRPQSARQQRRRRHYRSHTQPRASVTP